MRYKPTERALFALDSAPRIEGDTVYRTGKFFQIDQTFTDMNGLEFCLSEAEADAVLPKFTGGAINIEHTPTLFDGKLGNVTRTWKEGKDVVAEYAIPLWLHNVTEGAPLKISSEWDVATKTPLGAALVLNPAVKDAVMMAAFAAGMVSEMQAHHDMAARQGAECGGNAMFSDAEREQRAAIVKMMTPDTLKALQHIHDHAAKNGASCDVYVTKKSAMYYAAPVPTPEPSGIAGKGIAMFDTLRALFRRAGATDEEAKKATEEISAAVTTPAADKAPVTVSFADAPEYKALLSQINAVTQQNAQLVANMQAQQEQAQFAEYSRDLTDLVRQAKMTPAQAETWKEVARTNPAAFSIALPALKQAPVLPQLRAPRPVNLAAAEGDPGAKLVAMAQAHAKQTGMALDKALVLMADQNPELAAAHHEAMTEGGN